MGETWFCECNYRDVAAETGWSARGRFPFKTLRCQWPLSMIFVNFWQISATVASVYGDQSCFGPGSWSVVRLISCKLVRNCSADFPFRFTRAGLFQMVLIFRLLNILTSISLNYPFSFMFASSSGKRLECYNWQDVPTDISSSIGFQLFLTEVTRQCSSVLQLMIYNSAKMPRVPKRHIINRDFFCRPITHFLAGTNITFGKEFKNVKKSNFPKMNCSPHILYALCFLVFIKSSKGFLGFLTSFA